MQQRRALRYDVIIEFKENTKERWLFPKEALLEATNTNEPLEVRKPVIL
jgi:hypothetical protein